MNKLILLTLFSFSSVVNSATFGLKMGIPLSELKKKLELTKVENGIYESKSVPNNYQEFESYFLTVSPKVGLCSITAIGKNIKDNGFGRVVVNRFNKLELLLSKQYGVPERQDFLRSGSLWTQPNKWMMGLYDNDRTLASFWDNKKSPLPNSIQAIALDSKGYSDTGAYFILKYEFKNNSKCLESINSKTDSSL